MNTTDLVTSFDNSTNELLNAIALFTQEQFNTIPFEGSWTGAQVAEHLLKSESGIPHVLTGATIPTQRKPDEMMPIIESIFLDFTTKMKSPDSILPSDEVKQKETLYNALKDNRAAIRQLITTLDLTVTCTSFPFPQLGEFTRLEWADFLLCHATRHTRQMKNIYEVVSGE